MKVVLFATLLVCLLATTPMELARENKCVASVFDVVKPEIDAKLGQLKNTNDLALQADVFALITKGKKMIEKCNENKPAIQVGDAVEWEGYAFLLASNCFKDVGIELLLADTIVQNPTDYINDVMVGIFVAILTRQAIADCKQFEHFII